VTRLHADGRADITYDDGDQEEGVDPKWIAAVAYARPVGQAPVVATEAEGLRLHLSSSSATGYKGVVSSSHGRFRAQRTVGRSNVILGVFGTAVEAALAYARSVGEYDSPAVVAEAEGMRLHLSDRSATGYQGVHMDKGRFRAQRTVNGANHVLGQTFDTAVEAAVAYARAFGPPARAGVAPRARPPDGGRAEVPSEATRVAAAKGARPRGVVAADRAGAARQEEAAQQQQPGRQRPGAAAKAAGRAVAVRGGVVKGAPSRKKRLARRVGQWRSGAAVEYAVVAPQPPPPLQPPPQRPGGVDPCVLYKVGLEGVQGLTDAVFAMGRMIREAGKDPVTAQAVRQWS